MRKIIVSGFLSADAKRQISKQNREFITFSISNSEYNDAKDASGRLETHWFRVTAFNHNHITMSQYLTKGKPVIITGTYNDSLYQNKEGQQTISRDIIADSIDFLPNSRNNDAQTASVNPSIANKTNGGAVIPPSMPQVTPTGGVYPQNISSPTVTIPPSTATADNDDLPF